ncbi:MAG: hypothetical protein ACOCUI_00260 [bacterium]
MSDYMNTQCIRLETEYQDVDGIIGYLGKTKVLNEVKEKWGENYSIYDLNEELEKDNLRIINYKNRYYIDIILHNKWADGEDVSFYMAIYDVNKKIFDFTKKYGKIHIKNIIILVHSWYNGCEEPYSC